MSQAFQPMGMAINFPVYDQSNTITGVNPSIQQNLGLNRTDTVPVICPNIQQVALYKWINPN